MDEPDMDAANTRCTQCGATFTCGLALQQAQDEAACWCMGDSGLPPLPVPPAGSNATCLCPACLRSARARRAGVFSPM